MNSQKAIMALSQSEKIKAGIIWISQCLELLMGMPSPKAQTGQRLIRALADMVIQEVQLAKKIAKDEQWVAAEKDIEQAIVMINSGVGHESITHFTKALSQVTSIGQRSMSYLQSQGLI